MSLDDCFAFFKDITSQKLRDPPSKEAPKKEPRQQRARLSKRRRRKRQHPKRRQRLKKMFMDAVRAQGEIVKALKAAGKANKDPEVLKAVAKLKELKGI